MRRTSPSYISEPPSGAYPSTGLSVSGSEPRPSTTVSCARAAVDCVGVEQAVSVRSAAPASAAHPRFMKPDIKAH
ncbi:hypothetical protein GCM10010149_91560 [Nonomuraea roseoviolacea subsp. roseoviolacea]